MGVTCACAEDLAKMSSRVCGALAVGLCFLLQLGFGGEAGADLRFNSILEEVGAITPPVNIPCVLENCLVPFGECVLLKSCRDCLGCAEKCFNEWDNDTTKEKFHVQNCTNKCSFTYDTPTYEKLMGCLTSKKCISFPPIPNTCRAPNIHPLKNLSTSDLMGDWWIVRGYHPVYDCYPCQRVHFKPINSSYWYYSPQYQVYLLNGSLELVTQHTVIPSVPAGRNISFVYDDIGLLHYETWWLLDKADDGSYIIMYYCGNTLQWYYEGALVFARNRTLNASAYGDIARSYQKAVGLDFSKFCNTTTDATCPD